MDEKKIIDIKKQLNAGLIIRTYEYHCCGMSFSERKKFQEHLFHAHHEEYIIHFAGHFRKTEERGKGIKEKSNVLCCGNIPPIKRGIKKNLSIKGKYKEEQAASKEERLKRIKEKQEAKAKAIIERSEALMQKKVLPSKVEEAKFVKRTRKVKKSNKRKSKSARLIYTPMGNKR